MTTFHDFGIAINSSGVEVRTTCPQCSPTRKKKTDKCLAVNTVDECWFCHHCGWSGSLKEKTYKTFDDPKRELPEKVVGWFESRGISAGILEQEHIGYDGKAIKFPYFYNSVCVNIKSRTSDKRFWQEKGGLKCLYRLDKIRTSEQKTLVITEGECFHGDTEVLTKNGWISFECYSGGKVASVKLDGTFSCELIEPNAIIKKQYKGDLVKLSNRQKFSSVTTPDHNMVLKDKNDRIYKSHAKKISTSAKIQRVVNFDGQGTCLTNDEIALQLAVSADSKIDLRKNGNIYVHFEFKKQRKIERLSGILCRLGIKYTSYETKNKYTTFNFTAPAFISSKRFPLSWLTIASLDERKYIIEEMVHWDGNIVPNRDQYEFSSKNYLEATWMQTIAHTCGYCSTIITRSNELGKWYKVSVLLKKKTTSCQRSLKREFKKHDGLVYCVNVDSGALLVRHDGCIYVCGNCDALAIVTAGLEATSIPDGAPSANAKNFNSKFDFLKTANGVFDKFEKIVLAGDNDDPGERAIEELGRRIGYERCYVVSYPEGCKDINDVLKKHGKDEVKRVINSAKPFPVDGIISPADCVDDLLLEYENGIVGGDSTGWKSLDRLYTARVGEMSIVTGMPGSGKSNFVDALCLNLAMMHNWRIGYFSPENWPVKRHLKTLLEKLVNKTFDHTVLEKGKILDRMTTEDIREGSEWLEDHIRFILPKEEILSVETVLEYARVLCMQYGIKGLVLDPWNEFEHTQKPGEREDQYISRQLTAIRRFARFNGIHIWVIAHPTKLYKNSDGKYDPPTLYDISGGAQWRNKADNGFCVYRDFETNEVRVIVQKIRFREIGQLGEANFKYTFSGNYKEVL